jgi:hypothetical protein
VDIYTTKCDIYALDIDVRNHLKKLYFMIGFFHWRKGRKRERFCLNVFLWENMLKMDSFFSIFSRHFVRIYLSSYTVYYKYMDDVCFQGK